MSSPNIERGQKSLEKRTLNEKDIFEILLYITFAVVGRLLCIPSREIAMASAFEIRDASGQVRASVASDGTVTSRGAVVGFINPDGSAGDAYDRRLPSPPLSSSSSQSPVPATCRLSLPPPAPHLYDNILILYLYYIFVRPGGPPEAAVKEAPPFLSLPSSSTPCGIVSDREMFAVVSW